MNRISVLGLAAALAWTAPPAAHAAPHVLTLDATHAAIGFRAYAAGVWPADGKFARFSGTLAYDPAMPQNCRVDLTAEVASLSMIDNSLREYVLSPSLLDAGHYPTLSFSGLCAGDTLAGLLTLHGQTHPFTLAVTRNGTRYQAQGTLLRGDWGITGLPLLAGQRVRIQVGTTIPPQ